MRSRIAMGIFVFILVLQSIYSIAMPSRRTYREKWLTNTLCRVSLIRIEIQTTQLISRRLVQLGFAPRAKNITCNGTYFVIRSRALLRLISHFSIFPWHPSPVYMSKETEVPLCLLLLFFLLSHRGGSDGIKIPVFAHFLTLAASILRSTRDSVAEHWIDKRATILVSRHGCISWRRDRLKYRI